MSALGDASEHDVHNHDPAHHHEHRHDTDGDGKNCAGKVFPRVHQCVGSVDAKGVVLVVGNVATGPHQCAHFVLELQHVLRVGRLDKYQKFRTGYEVTTQSGERNHHKVILTHTEGGAHFFGHANDPKGLAAHYDFLFERIGAGKKFIHQVLPNKADMRIVVIILLADVAA